MTFASLEARLNASCAAKMANASALIAGVEVDVIFHNDYAATRGGIGMEASAPAMELLTASVPANPRNNPVVINGTSYEIAEHHPDGTGWSVCMLRVIS